MLIYWAPLLAVLLWRAYWRRRAAEVAGRTDDGFVVIDTPARIHTPTRHRWPIFVSALPGVLSVALLVGAMVGPAGASSNTPCPQPTPTSHSIPVGHP